MTRREPRAGACAAVALALVAGCAGGPALRPVTAHQAATGDFTVLVEQLHARGDLADLAVDVQASATTPSAIEGVALSPAAAPPCADPQTLASAFVVDGAPAPTWQRPLQLSGTHRLRLEFPGQSDLTSLDDAVVMDVWLRRGDRGECLRVPLVEANDTVQWRPVNPYMLGLGLGTPGLTLGLRAGRWFGPVLAGIEVAAGAARASGALLAQGELTDGLGVEAGFVTWWELAGGAGRARGSFRYGPRVVVGTLTPMGRRALGGGRLGLAGFGISIARWLARDSEPAQTEIGLQLVVWFGARRP